MNRSKLGTLVVLGIVLAACTPQSAAMTATPAATTPATEQRTTAATGSTTCVQPVKVAIIGAMSGTNAVLGDWMKKGVTLAIEEKNASGGIHGCQVELVIYDDEGDPTKSMELAQKVVKEDKVMAAWATTNSASALADIRTFQEYEIPQLTFGTNVKITQTGSAYVFRVNPAGPAYEDPLVDYLVAQKYTKFAIIGDNSAYGVGETGYQQAALDRHSLKAVDTEAYSVDAKDFSEQLTRIFQATPDVLLLAGSEVASGLIARQARQLGFKGVIAGGAAVGTPKFVEAAGDAAEGIYFTVPYPGNNANDKTRAFAAAYKKRWGEEPESHGANTYDGMTMLLMAMDKAFPFTPKNVAAEMHNICGYEGLQGTFCYDNTGEGIKTTFLGVIKGGNLTIVPK